MGKKRTSKYAAVGWYIDRGQATKLQTICDEPNVQNTDTFVCRQRHCSLLHLFFCFENKKEAKVAGNEHWSLSSR